MDVARLSSALQAGLTGLRDSSEARPARANSDGTVERHRSADSGREASSTLAREGGKLGQAIDGLGERGTMRGGGGAFSGEDAALVNQAMALLNQLAELDPQARGLQQRARQLMAQPETLTPPPAPAPVPEDPAELFALFVRDLRAALQRLAPIASRKQGDGLVATMALQAAIPGIQAAAAWWQGRTLARGRAEAQLQELKLFLEDICSRSAGLAVLMTLIETRGQAVRSLLGEVDVLRRILQRAVEGARPLVDKRHAATVGKLEANIKVVERAEQSIDIINHLETQLRGAKAQPQAWALVERRDVVRSLRQIQRQLDFFRPTGAAALGGGHVAEMTETAEHIQKLLGWHELPELYRGEWERLEAICGLLLIRLRSASSWVDKSALEAIVGDLREAVRLAIESCELEEQVPSTVRKTPSGPITIDDLAMGIRFTRPIRPLTDRVPAAVARSEPMTDRP